MEGIVLLILIAGGLVLSAILGLVAFIRQLTGSVGGGDGTRVRELERRVRRLEERVGRLVREAGEWEEVAPEEEVRAAEPAEPPETVEEKEVVEEEEEVGAEVAPPSPPEIPPTLPEEPAAEEEPVWARFERTVGKQWIAWAGALVIFLAVGFFVKYAIDVGWLGPTARCALGLVAGIVMAVAGDLFVRREMRGLGQGLIGGGLAVMYFSIFAAFSFYDLIPQTVAFGAMVLVTAGGMTLAVLHDALVVAMLAVIGGLLTPVLCNTGANRRDTLFLYLTVLDLGVLGVALFRRWRALDVVAFVGTWVLFAGWYAEFYAPEALVATTVWLMVFFLIFLVLPFAYHLRMRQRVPLERFVMELVNAATVFGFAFAMFHPEHQHVLGFVVLGMAACYVALGQASRSLLGAARELFGFVALAMIFLTIAVPLHLGLNGTLIGWAAEALVLLYLGYRFGYMPVRFGAAGVLAVAVVRFLTVFWPLHEGAFVLFWNTRFGTAVCLPLAGAIFVLLHRRWRESRVLPDRVLQAVAGVVSCLLFLLILHGEVGQWLVAWEGADPAFDGEFYALFARSLIWVVGGAAMLAVGLGVRSEAVRRSGLLPCSVVPAGETKGWSPISREDEQHIQHLYKQIIPRSVQRVEPAPRVKDIQGWAYHRQGQLRGIATFTWGPKGVLVDVVMDPEESSLEEHITALFQLLSPYHRDRFYFRVRTYQQKIASALERVGASKSPLQLAMVKYLAVQFQVKKLTNLAQLEKQPDITTPFVKSERETNNL